MEHFYTTGDLVVLRNRDYKNLREGTVGIITSTYGNLVNVVFPEGSWAFPKWDLEPLAKEESCK